MLLPALLSQAPVLPPVPREFRAAWVATVDNIDWPSRRGLPAARQKAEMVRLLDRAVTLKLNAIVFQVRPSADALYRSKLEPWSEYLTGHQGVDPGYDPLAFTVAEAHRRGIEVHAWFNPYRAKAAAAKGPLAANHLARTNPTVVKPYGKNQLWMDPGEPVVQKRSLDVVLDVVRRYDIDGVHLDDYFYPYPENDAPFPDGNVYARYGGGLTLGDWRRKNVDDFIQSLSTQVHAAKPWVQVGISPFGIWRPGYPEGTTAGIDQYNTLYADCRKWLRLGWCDYLAPQLYWAIAKKPQSFPVLFKWWEEENVKGRHVWPGLYTSRLLPGEARGGYTTEEIVRQIEITRRAPDAGHVHFSMKALTEDAHGVSDALRGGLYAQDALPPASPWLDDVPPKPPILGPDYSWRDGDPADPAFRHVLWMRYGTKWIVRVLAGGIHSVAAAPRLAIGPLNVIAVADADRSGNLSEAAYFGIVDGGSSGVGS